MNRLLIIIIITLIIIFAVLRYMKLLITSKGGDSEGKALGGGQNLSVGLTGSRLS